MATREEIRRLTQAATEAQDALSRALSETVRADEAWARMCAEAERSIASGTSVSAEFIIAAGARRRAGQGIAEKRPAEQRAEPRKVVPLHEWRSDIHGTDAIIPRSRRW
jgi:hypothetical protein